MGEGNCSLLLLISTACDVFSDSTFLPSIYLATGYSFSSLLIILQICPFPPLPWPQNSQKYNQPMILVHFIFFVV